MWCMEIPQAPQRGPCKGIPVDSAFASAARASQNGAMSSGGSGEGESPRVAPRGAAGGEEAPRIGPQGSGEPISEGEPRGWIEVRVPASTSNLGPGFDLLGWALDLYLTVRLLGPSEGPNHQIVPRPNLLTTRDRVCEWPTGGDNLLFRAFDAARSSLGSTDRGGRRFQVSSEIPTARGLGSSAAAIVAGLLLARAEHQGGTDPAAHDLDAPLPEAWIELAVELEGHPDNVLPAALGGLVLGWRTNEGGVGRRSLRVSPGFGLAVAWPETPVSTWEAREVLPATLPRERVVAQGALLARLLEGLREGDGELLRGCGRDHLHVPHRLGLVPGGTSALQAAERAGAHLATLSGSGSALFAVAPPDRAGRIAEAMGAAFRQAGQDSVARVVRPVFGTPSVRRVPRR